MEVQHGLRYVYHKEDVHKGKLILLLLILVNFNQQQEGL